MKYSIGILFLVLTLTGHAKSGLRLVVPYTVVSDKVATDVPNGFCRVFGNASKAGFPLSNGLIGNYDITHKTKTDSLGNFSFLIPERDSVIFFFAVGNNEIVINPYDFQSGHQVEINFYVQDNIEIMVVDKPVIYLYSEEELNVNIGLSFLGDLKFTYPAYEEGWDVQIDENGIQNNADQKEYPYLFWEGEMPSLNFDVSEETINGSFVKTDTLVAFLENQLNALGFNQREQTDFISFWAPRMMHSDYTIVQFLVDEEYDAQIAGINVMPQPNAMRRVYLLFAPVAESLDLNFIPQTFKPFERIGFTVLEWGGSEVIINTKNS